MRTIGTFGFVLSFLLLFTVLGTSGLVAADTAVDTTLQVSETNNTTNNTSDNTSDDEYTAEDLLQADTEENESQTTIGYWEGVRYNDSFSFDEQDEDYLNQSEQEKLTRRAIARIEYIRNSTFNQKPTVNIVTRDAYQKGSGGYTQKNGSAKKWNNIVWKSMFMVDENTNVEAELSKLYGGQVKAFYSPSQDEVYMIVSESQTDIVKFQSTSLVHELVHAYQDQKFDLDNQALQTDTQDAELSKNSIVEGEAVYIERQYEEYCESGVWDCYESNAESTTSGDSIHLGLQLTAFFPYSDGYAYVDHTLDEGGWNKINNSYNDPPTHTSQIIHYNQGVNTETVDVTVDGKRWERYSHGANGKESVGEATLAMMFWYQQNEYGIDTGISDADLTQTTDGSTYNYNYSVTDNLQGDAVVPITHKTESNKTGYIFKTQWNADADATEFKQGYINILNGHGATKHSTKLTGDVYVISNESGYTGVYYIEQDGNTLEITQSSTLSEIKNIQSIETKTKDVTDRNRIQEFLNTIPLPTIIALILAVLLLIGISTKYLVIDVWKKQR